MSVVVTRKRGPVRPDARNVVRGQETRRRILAIARARILAQGFEELRLDDLARDAGVTKGAVVKSVGGKPSILLALSEEDRQTRIAILEDAKRLTSGLERRLLDVTRRLLRVDVERLNLILAFIGYSWFWRDEDRDRAHAMMEDTRQRASELIVAASADRLGAKRLEILSKRLLAAYASGLRDIQDGRRSLEETVRFVVDFALD
jgi:AcrR family transcriptional regulator